MKTLINVANLNPVAANSCSGQKGDMRNRDYIDPVMATPNRVTRSNRLSGTRRKFVEADFFSPWRSKSRFA